MKICSMLPQTQVNKVRFIAVSLGVYLVFGA
jgi:hypothetical protein